MISRDWASFQIADGGKKARFVRHKTRQSLQQSCAAELPRGMEPTPTRSGRAGHARLNLTATWGIPMIMIS